MADLEFIVPGVLIDESDVGPRPVKELSLSGIGIVGTFEKGPLNEPTIIGDEVQLIKKFGNHSKGLTGVLSALSALRQGANDLCIVRVAGTGGGSASKTFNDGGTTPKEVLKITANSPGTWGNQIKIGIKRNTSNFDLTIKCGKATELFEGLTYSNLKEKVISNFIQIEWLEGTEELLPKNTTTDISLELGNNGAATTDDDYIGAIDSDTGSRTGLKAIEPRQVGLVICAQQYSTRIRAALIAFAKGCDIEEGLRLGVLNSAPRLSVDSAIQQTETLDADRGIFAYPWIRSTDFPDEWIAPDGFLAGVIATCSPHESPSNKEVQGILETENNYVHAEVKALTQARICPITLKRNRGFRVRNGLTLASDQAWTQICIRRQQDRMNMELYFGMEWAISLPHEKKLWDLVAETIDLYLAKQKTLGRIRGYKPTLCDSQTNPPELVTSRILAAILRWLPLYPADFILMKWRRELTNDDE